MYTILCTNVLICFNMSMTLLLWPKTRDNFSNFFVHSVLIKTCSLDYMIRTNKRVGLTPHAIHLPSLIHSKQWVGGEMFRLKEIMRLLSCHKHLRIDTCTTLPPWQKKSLLRDNKIVFMSQLSTFTWWHLHKTAALAKKLLSWEIHWCCFHVTSMRNCAVTHC